MKKIVVPIDFSVHAENALNFALQFNIKIGAEIVLLHVLEFPSSSFSVTGQVSSGAEAFFHGEFIKATNNRLEAWKKKVEDVGQVAETRMEYGSPYVNIGKEVARVNADWLIIGSKGASGFDEVFIGSNAERMIRHAKCPVITVKGSENDLSDMRSIVYASDLTEEQQPVVEKIKELQRLFHVNVHVVLVKHNYLTEREAQDNLKKFAESAALENYTLNTASAYYADEGILSFAEEVNAGMIVMGTHGRTGLAHLFGGSKAEDVANHSKIPVMTVRVTE